MALSAKHRSSIFQQLSPLIGEDEVEALLSQFPARELDEPVTRGFVRAEVAELRAGMASLEARVAERLRQQTVWMAGAMALGMGLAAGIGTLAG